MREEDRVFLLHILAAIERISEYTEESSPVFFEDSKTQDAVLRNLEIIGEAVKNLSMELRQAHDHVPWKQIAGMRDRLIHGYFSVNLELVFEVVRKELPKLQQNVTSLLNP